MFFLGLAIIIALLLYRKAHRYAQASPESFANRFLQYFRWLNFKNPFVIVVFVLTSFELISFLIIFLVSVTGISNSGWYSLSQGLKESWATPRNVDNILNFSNSYMGDPYLGFRLRPGYKSRYITNTRSKSRIDDAGLIPNDFVGNAPIGKKDADIYRIFMLGGSTMQGIDLGNDQTLSAYMERMANKDTELLELLNVKSVQAINAGVSGYFSTPETLYCMLYLQWYYPDHFIFLDGTNDWFHTMYPDWHRHFSHMNPKWNLIGLHDVINRGVAIWKGVTLSRQLYPLSYNLGQHLYIKYLRVVKGEDYWQKVIQSRYRNKNGPDVDSPYREDLIPTFRRNMMMFRDITLNSNWRATYFLQPTLGFRKPLLHGNERTTVNYYRYLHPQKKMYFSRFRKLFAELSNMSSDQVYFEDITGVFENDSSHIYTDNVHYTPYGNEQIVKAMIEAIKKQLRMRGEP